MVKKSKWFLMEVGVLAGFVIGGQAYAGHTAKLSLENLPTNLLEDIVVDYVLPGQFIAFAKCAKLDDESRDELRKKWLKSGKFHIKFVTDKLFKPIGEHKDEFQREIDSGEITVEQYIEGMNSDFDEAVSKLHEIDAGELGRRVGKLERRKDTILSMFLTDKDTFYQLVRGEVLTFTKDHGGDVRSLGKFFNDLEEASEEIRRQGKLNWDVRMASLTLDRLRERGSERGDEIIEYRRECRLARKLWRTGGLELAGGVAACIAGLMSPNDGLQGVIVSCGALLASDFFYYHANKDREDSRIREEGFLMSGEEIDGILLRISYYEQVLEPYLRPDPDNLNTNRRILTLPEVSREKLQSLIKKLKKYPLLYFVHKYR